MTIRGAIPNTAKRLADNFGVSTDLRSSIPNTAARLAMALGASFPGQALPNNEERIADAFGLVGGGSYVGPLDLVPGAKVAYSPARALSTTWIGQNVIKLRRDSDDATMDFVAGADGSVDVAAVTAWLDGANGLLHTLYDQSGNGINLTTVFTAFPLWVASAQGSRPGLSFSSGGAFRSTSTFGLVDGFAVLAVCKSTLGFINTTGTGTLDNWLGRNSLDQAGLNAVDGDSNACGANFDTSGLSNATTYAWSGKAKTGASTLQANGVAVAQSSSNDAGGALEPFTVNIRIGSIDDGPDPVLQEFLMYPTDTVVTTAYQNVATYYSITLP